MLLIGGGILLIILAILSKMGGNTFKTNLYHLKDSRPDKIADIIHLYHQAHLSMGQGNFVVTFENYAKVSPEKTLLSPFSKTPCIYYKAQLQRIIGANRTKEKIFEKEEFTDFYLEDDTGKIQIQHRDLKEQLQKIAKEHFNEFRQHFNEFDLPIPQHNEAIVGYQLQEQIIPVGQTLYLYGQATDRNGELMVARFLHGDQPFIVSDLSKQEYISSLQKEVQSINYGAPIIFFVGVALILYAFWP